MMIPIDYKAAEKLVKLGEVVELQTVAMTLNSEGSSIAQEDDPIYHYDVAVIYRDFEGEQLRELLEFDELGKSMALAIHEYLENTLGIVGELIGPRSFTGPFGICTCL